MIIILNSGNVLSFVRKIFHVYIFFSLFIYRQANLLRTQYQRLTHIIGTLLPAPIATFDPGLDGSLTALHNPNQSSNAVVNCGKDDSGFVDIDGETDGDYGEFGGHAAAGADASSTRDDGVTSNGFKRGVPRRKSFNGVLGILHSTFFVIL
jgi:hypothetical protein